MPTRWRISRRPIDLVNSNHRIYQGRLRCAWLSLLATGTIDQPAKLAEKVRALGDDVTVHPQKHYMAFRRNRNFASVQIYNQKQVIRIYLNLDPDSMELDLSMMRDVRQIGHFGTGDLEITIKSKKDIEKVSALIEASYAAS